MYFSLFPLETYDGIYKSFEARSERAKKKSSIQYHLWTSLSRGETESPTLADFYYQLNSVQFRSRSSKYLYSNVKPSFFLWPHFS